MKQKPSGYAELADAIMQTPPVKSEKPRYAAKPDGTVWDAIYNRSICLAVDFETALWLVKILNK
jgi:hypothetical protein